MEGRSRFFDAICGGTSYALKFLRAPTPSPIFGPLDQTVGVVDEITERAKREVETMRQCRSAHLVRLGPIGLCSEQIAGQDVIYFFEEWIEGQDLKTDLADSGPLGAAGVISLGLQVTEAIDELWSYQKIHRDIKPANIK